MACYAPMQAEVDEDGLVTGRIGPHLERTMRIPCGYCVGCRLDKASFWSVRCMHEASLWDRNCFVTLTYEDHALPEKRSLQYRDVQLFLKRLRKEKKGDLPAPGSEKRPVRFFCAGEYGELEKRPHYHLLLFNVGFDDLKPVRTSLYESELLNKLWQKGYASVGNVTPASAAYVSQYALKKVYGRHADHYHYRGRVPEFIEMSVRPGIGHWWYEKFEKDILPRDYVIVDGKKRRVPRYYLEKLKAEKPEVYDGVVAERQRKGMARPAVDQGRDRLRIAGTVAAARVEFNSKRSL
jgi:hypothetical protein